MMTLEQRRRERENPWSISEADYPRRGTVAQRLRFALNYAILAPSNYNSQPWRFRIVADDVEVYADRRRGLSAIDPDDRELIMSCGAALYNLRVAIRHFGSEPIVRLFPDLDDADLLAFVRLGRSVDVDEQVERQFRAIMERRTNRMQLDDEPVEHDVMQRLQQIAKAEGIELHRIDRHGARSRLADLVEQGVVAQALDKHARRELAAWSQPNRSRSRDGVPGHAHGLSNVRSIAEPLILRAADWGPERGANHRQAVIDAPELIVLTTRSDSTHAWLEAGQALQAILLACTDGGLAASFLNQPIQVPHLRPQVAQVLGADRRFPQVMMRLGYGSSMRATPRRTLADVLTSNKYI